MKLNPKKTRIKTLAATACASNSFGNSLENTSVFLINPPEISLITALVRQQTTCLIEVSKSSFYR